jgi:gas vesicle protein
LNYFGSIKTTKMKTNKVFLGILAGFATGATLAILFAPDKGSRTRRKIYHKDDSYSEGLEKRYNEYMDGVSHPFEKANKEASLMAESSKRRARNIADEATSATANTVPKLPD